MTGYNFHYSIHCMKRIFEKPVCEVKLKKKTGPPGFADTRKITPYTGFSRNNQLLREHP